MNARIWHHAIWIDECDPTRLRNKLSDLLTTSGFHVLNLTEHHFTPIGYTALWLLSESHLAIHTFPEHGETYLELSSCVPDAFHHFIRMLGRSL